MLPSSLRIAVLFVFCFSCTTVPTYAAVRNAHPAEDICTDGIKPPSPEIAQWLGQRATAFEEQKAMLPPLSEQTVRIYATKIKEIFSPFPPPQGFSLAPCTDYSNALLAANLPILAIGSVFRNASLIGQTIYGSMAGIHFEKADFQDADLRLMRVQAANFDEAVMSSAKLDYADISRSNFRDAKLNNASLKQAVAYGTKFANADLSFADLTSATIDYADLTNANLNSASLENAYLYHSNASGANMFVKSLKGADLTETLLISTALSTLAGARLRGANLSYACLSPLMDFGAIDPKELKDVYGLETMLFDPVNDCASRIAINARGKVTVAPWLASTSSSEMPYSPLPVIPVHKDGYGYDDNAFHAPTGFLAMHDRLHKAGYRDAARAILYAYGYNKERFFRYRAADQFARGHYSNAINAAAGYAYHAAIRASTGWGLWPAHALLGYALCLVLGWIIFLAALVRQTRRDETNILFVSNDPSHPSRNESVLFLIRRAFWLSLSNGIRFFWRRSDESSLLILLHPAHPVFFFRGSMSSFATLHVLFCNYFLFGFLIAEYFPSFMLRLL